MSLNRVLIRNEKKNQKLSIMFKFIEQLFDIYNFLFNF